MSEALGTFGVSLILAWAVLPILALIARGAHATAASRQRALTFALGLSALMFLAPFVRVWTHHFTALCMSAQSAAATIVLAPTRPLSDGHLAPTLLQLVGMIGVLAVLVGLLRLVANALSLRAVLARAHEAPPEITALAARIAASLQLPAPEARISHEAAVPFVTKGTIVLPEALLPSLGEEELELVLAHELTHLHRKDVELAWLVAICRVPFSLHPAARWVAREIAVAREEAVDALVGARSPYAYARLLVDVAAHARFGRCSSLVAMEPSDLERRISVLIDPSAAPRRRSLPVIIAGVAFIFLTMIAPRPAETRPIASAWGHCVDESPAALAPMPPPFEIDEEACAESYECHE
jgi:beta-lactamase regulating signal transducer with metallopeptidase domain